LDRAVGLGFDAVSTGHYARLSVVDGVPSLRRSADLAKDQSYVLASLRADQLRHAMFPLGDSTKPVVRAEAAARGLAVAEKPDSHDICFIPDGDTRSFLNGRLGTRAGSVIDDETGAVLGQHDGVHGFTVGQRKGIGVEAPAATGRPRYVLALEPVTGNVRVGAAERLAVTEITGIRPVWPGGVPLTDVSCTVQVRAHGGLAPATATLVGDELVIRLAEPLSGVAPGQAAVLYQPDASAGDLVLASTTISATR
jgi:tRNA-specific 2-thiouridylase